MNSLRSLAFYLIIFGWLIFLVIFCALYIFPFPMIINDVITFIPLLVMIAYIFLAKKINQNLSQEQRIFIKRGAILATSSVLISNLIFLTIEETQLIILFGFDPSQFNFVLLLEIIIGTSLFSAIPSFIFGQFLAFTLLQDSLHKVFSAKLTIVKGILLGITLGISLCIIVGTALNGHGSFNIWLYRSIIVIILAALAGGWTSWKLCNLILKQQTTFLSD